MPDPRSLPRLDDRGEDVFWSRVILPHYDVNECWRWRGSFGSNYPVFNYGKIHVYAHRIALELANGVIPEGMIVRHSCDRIHGVADCVNPLSLGTHRDNAHDHRVHKERQRHSWPEDPRWTNPLIQWPPPPWKTPSFLYLGGYPSPVL